MPVYTVSQVTEYLREKLEQDPLLADLWVSGEASNLATSQAGHTYFTLKDAESQLRCVMFSGGRGALLLFDGSAVTAHGRITLYQARGQLQFNTDLVMPEGVGPLALEFERLKAALEDEGLFDPSRKRPLPRFPQVIGLVTSPTGAAVADICKILGARYPLVEVLLAPTPVQGAEAAAGIQAALRSLNDEGRSDVIILARGGGSLEELWPFNEELVARAIYASRIPVVSAVGHERDYTIADFVADLRAPTPTAAAEMVVPDRAALRQEIAAQDRRGLWAFSSHLQDRRQSLQGMRSRLDARAPDVVALRRRIVELTKAASATIQSRLSVLAQATVSLDKRIQTLSPVATLHRGYAIVQKDGSGQVVSQRSQVKAGEELKVTVSDGAFPVTAKGAPSRRRRPSRVSVPAGRRLF